MTQSRKVVPVQLSIGAGVLAISAVLAYGAFLFPP